MAYVGHLCRVCLGPSHSYSTNGRVIELDTEGGGLTVCRGRGREREVGGMWVHERADSNTAGYKCLPSGAKTCICELLPGRWSAPECLGTDSPMIGLGPGCRAGGSLSYWLKVCLMPSRLWAIQPPMTPSISWVACSADSDHALLCMPCMQSLCLVTGCC